MRMDPSTICLFETIYNNEAPEGHHGKELPENGMPWRGDVFLLENSPTTVVVYTWWGFWDIGPTIITKPREAV